MRVEIDEDGSIEPYRVDESGRITVGKEFAGERIRAIVLGRIGDSATVPTELPRFHGDIESSREGPPAKSERAAAMLGHSERDAPYWFGFAAENGTEVGIGPTAHSRHVLIACGNERERRKALEFQYKQVLSRGHGGIFHFSESYRPLSFEAVAREAGREDEIININAEKGDSDGVNLLALPSGRSDGLKAVKETVNGLAQGWNSESPRSLLLIWNIVRAISESESPGNEATLLDVAYVVSQDAAAAGISEERAERLDELFPEGPRTAGMVREDFGPEDAEPLLRRLQQWLNHEGTRNALSSRNPTANLADAIDDGKIIVVRNGLAAAPVALALMERAANTRTLQRRTEFGDLDPYYCFSDNIEQLSNVGPVEGVIAELPEHGMTFVAGCPRLSGWERAESIARAFGTHLTFKPGQSSREVAANLHSEEVTELGLSDLRSEEAYFRTETASRTLDSIRIQPFAQE